MIGTLFKPLSLFRSHGNLRENLQQHHQKTMSLMQDYQQRVLELASEAPTLRDLRQKGAAPLKTYSQKANQLHKEFYQVFKSHHKDGFAEMMPAARYRGFMGKALASSVAGLMGFVPSQAVANPILFQNIEENFVKTQKASVGDKLNRPDQDLSDQDIKKALIPCLEGRETMSIETFKTHMMASIKRGFNLPLGHIDQCHYLTDPMMALYLTLQGNHVIENLPLSVDLKSAVFNSLVTTDNLSEVREALFASLEGRQKRGNQNVLDEFFSSYMTMPYVSAKNKRRFLDDFFDDPQSVQSYDTDLGSDPTKEDFAKNLEDLKDQIFQQAFSEKSSFFEAYDFLESLTGLTQEARDTFLKRASGLIAQNYHHANGKMAAFMGANDLNPDLLTLPHFKMDQKDYSLSKFVSGGLLTLEDAKCLTGVLIKNSDSLLFPNPYFALSSESSLSDEEKLQFINLLTQNLSVEQMSVTVFERLFVENQLDSLMRTLSEEAPLSEASKVLCQKMITLLDHFYHGLQDPGSSRLDPFLKSRELKGFLKKVRDQNFSLSKREKAALQNLDQEFQSSQKAKEKTQFSSKVTLQKRFLEQMYVNYHDFFLGDERFIQAPEAEKMAYQSQTIPLEHVIPHQIISNQDFYNEGIEIEKDVQKSLIRGAPFRASEGPLGYTIALPEGPPVSVLVNVYGGGTKEDRLDIAFRPQALDPVSSEALRNGVVHIDLNLPDLLENDTEQEQYRPEYIQKLQSCIHQFYETLRTNPESLHPQLSFLKNEDIPLFLKGASFGGGMVMKQAEQYPKTWSGYISHDGSLPLNEKTDFYDFQNRPLSLGENFDFSRLQDPLLIMANAADNNVSVRVATRFIEKALEAGKDNLLETLTTYSPFKLLENPYDSGHYLPEESIDLTNYAATLIRFTQKSQSDELNIKASGDQKASLFQWRQTRDLLRSYLFDKTATSEEVFLGYAMKKTLERGRKNPLTYQDLKSLFYTMKWTSDDQERGAESLESRMQVLLKYGLIEDKHLEKSILGELEDFQRMLRRWTGTSPQILQAIDNVDIDSLLPTYRELLSGAFDLDDFQYKRLIQRFLLANPEILTNTIDKLSKNPHAQDDFRAALEKWDGYKEKEQRAFKAMQAKTFKEAHKLMFEQEISPVERG